MSLSKARIKPYKRLTLAKPMPSTTDIATAPYRALEYEIEAAPQAALTPLTQYGAELADLARRLGLTLDPVQTTAEERQKLIGIARQNLTPDKHYSLTELALVLSKSLRLNRQKALKYANKLINQRAVLQEAPNMYTLNTMY
jgi:predicted outer membrane protein